MFFTPALRVAVALSAPTDIHNAYGNDDDGDDVDDDDDDHAGDDDDGDDDGGDELFPSTRLGGTRREILGWLGPWPSSPVPHQKLHKAHRA